MKPGEHQTLPGFHKKILLVGGGTLGSVTPLLAVTEELKTKHPDWSFAWWGTAQGPEGKIVEEAGIPFFVIPAGKLRRYLDKRNLTDFFHIAQGFFASLWRFGVEPRPNAVLTAGSFVATPVGWAALCHDIPVFVHQQDVRSGLANKLLKPFARKITVTFENSRHDFPGSVLTGNPVRKSFIQPPSQSSARQKFGLMPDIPTITVIGGGTGAVTLNRLTEKLADELPNVQILHITGLGKLETPSRGHYHSLEFTTDTLNALVAADVVVTRAGMGVLTELATLKKAAVIVPISCTHQEDNAAAVAKVDAGMVLRERRLTVTSLADTVSALLSDTNRRTILGEHLAGLLLVNGAAGRIASLVEEVLDKS